jgi:hypothetical protein
MYLLAVRVVQYCQRTQGRECEVQRVQPLAHFSTKLLPEQRLDIRLIIDNQHPYGHGTGLFKISRQAWAFDFVAMFPPAGQNVTRRLPVCSDAKPGQGLGPNLLGTSVAGRSGLNC